MEEDNNICTKGEKIRGEEDKCENESVVKRASVLLKDDAGPSRVNDLPGAISHISNNTFSIKSGVSKSEHCIRQIVTNKDVPQGIQLTSLSFGSPKQTKNIEINEIKIPILNSLYNEKEGDPATLVELKKIMASCFKFNKDGCNALNEVVNTVQPNNGTIANELIHNIPNASSFTNKGFINEVAVTNPNALNGTQLKSVPSNKKKSSGILSEKSEIGIAQRDSLSSIGSNVCRICMTKGRERLISPCNCKGSLANVHLTCLERWLNQVGRNHCELCGFSYPAIRTPRYTILQALRLWFGNPRNRSHLQSDCLIFWLLSTVTAGLLAVCIVGTQYFVIEGNNFGKLDPARKNEETAMDFFMAIVLCGYSVTVYLLWKDHFVMWNRWRRANVNVRLLLSPDSNPVPFTPRPRYNIV